MKRLLAILLALMLLLPAGAMAQETSAEPKDLVCGDYCYTLDDNGAATITLYFGNAKMLTIPQELDGHPVTAIGPGAFYLCDPLVSVTIPEGVTSIGSGAFLACGELMEVNLPNSVTRISAYAFGGCDSLVNLTIPNSVTNMGVQTSLDWPTPTQIIVSPDHPELEVIDGVLFSKSKKELISYPCTREETSYTIPDGTLSIGLYAFRGCKTLQSITIPNSVTTIGQSAFYGCDSLESIVIPEGVVYISDYAFERCEALASVTLPDGVMHIGKGAFAECTALTSITLPNGLRYIEDNTFYGCEKLESVTLPPSVFEIGRDAFADCTALESINLDDVMLFDRTPFADCVKLPYHVRNMGKFVNYGGIPVRPSGPDIPKEKHSYGDYRYLLNDDGTATIVEYTGKAETLTISAEVNGHRVTAIEGAFIDNESLTSVVIPEGVTTIGKNAFARCTALASVTLPDSVTTIDDEAFTKCEALASIIIPEGVTTVGKQAFYNCAALTSVTLPDSLVYIGDSAFNDCVALADIMLPPNLWSIEEAAFNACAMTQVTIPEGINAIKDYAFGGCTALTSVTIPDSVTFIGEGAFAGCAALTSVTIPAGVTFMGRQAFGGCESLTDVTICDGVACIGAFSGCAALTSITIPDSVQSIESGGMNPFYDCAALTEIIVSPDHPELQVVDGVLFSKSEKALLCYPLGKQDAAYVIPDWVETVGNRAFLKCTALTSITIPASVTSIKRFAFGGCAVEAFVVSPGSYAEQYCKDNNLNYTYPDVGN